MVQNWQIKCGILLTIYFRVLGLGLGLGSVALALPPLALLTSLTDINIGVCSPSVTVSNPFYTVTLCSVAVIGCTVDAIGLPFVGSLHQNQ